MKNIVKSLFIFAVLVFPSQALAQVTIQGTPNTAYIDTWVEKLLKFGQQLTTFLMIAATLYFIWTVIGYIRAKDATKAEESKKAMIRGIIGLFVIVAIWGIVRLITSTLGVGTGSLNSRDVPCPPGMIYNTSVTPPRCI
ncbi:hypothetical protein IT402_01320 [Candidatus Nomurabacteria bacterium]|nr:hypothetical protein [Candidatus Nomurabacteria bacterium]